MKYYIGIDLGGTNIVAAVVNEASKIKSKLSCNTNLPRKPELVADDMAKLARKAAEQADIPMDAVDKIGIGCPGIINQKSGMIEYSCNFHYHNVPMAQMMKNRLHKEVYMENDANAAAVGEFVSGAGVGTDSMVAVTLGTGIGGGIILNHKVYSGFNYAGGELGHTVIQRNGRPCNCGRKGCFEAYASATGLVKTTEEMMAKHPQSKMWDISQLAGKVSGRTAFDGMRAGDEAAKQTVDLFINDLACGIINIINTFQPELICIGGGISKEGKTLTDPLQAIIDKEDYARNSGRRCNVVAAKLGNDAGLIGAAMIFRFQ